MEMKQYKQQRANNTHQLAVCILWAGALGILITFLLLLAAAWMFTRARLPMWSYIPIAVWAVCVGSFFSGYIVANRVKKNGLFCGLCCGIVFFVIYLIASLLTGDFDYTALLGIKLVSYSLAGSLGGLIGVATAQKKRRI